jgi:periplasmic copper chaperone A
VAVAVAGYLGAAMLPAAAHVTVNPEEALSGGYAKLAFRVPNERDNAGTTRLEIVFPAEHPIASVRVKPHAGWTVNVTKAKLATPVSSGHGGTASEAVSKIVWEGGIIKPGEFDEFEVSVGPLPEDVDALTFKALQTYANGEIVRWIEEPGPGGAEPEHPAPVLKLVATGDVGPATAGEDAATTNPTVGTVTAGGEVEPLAGVASQQDLDSANRLTAVALVVGVVALGMGLIALVAARAKKQQQPAPTPPQAA